MRTFLELLKSVPREFWFVALLVAVWFGRGCERDSYWQAIVSRSDTVRVVQKIPVPDETYRARFVDSLTAVQSLRQQQVLQKLREATEKSTSQRDSLSAHISRLESQLVRYTNIKTLQLRSEALGSLTLHYDPLTEFVDFVHDPPPMHVETVTVTVPAPPDCSVERLGMFAVLGAAVGALAVVLITSN